MNNYDGGAKAVQDVSVMRGIVGRLSEAVGYQAESITALDKKLNELNGPRKDDVLQPGEPENILAQCLTDEISIIIDNLNRNNRKIDSINRRLSSII